MSIMEWNDSLHLGINELDDHHKWLVGLLNKSYELYKSGACTATLATVIKELHEFASYHFEAEEYWMSKHSYPMLEVHKEQHDSFSRKVDVLQRDFLESKESLSAELFRFLAGWVRTHILETDAHYGRYIAEKGLAVW